MPDSCCCDLPGKAFRYKAGKFITAKKTVKLYLHMMLLFITVLILVGCSIKAEGTIPFNDGEYTGEIKNDMPHGQGTWIGANNEKYTGGWENGKMHGYGVMTDAVGGEYKGNWWYGNKYSYGLWVDADGNRYEGYFEDNVLNGLGSWTGPDGSEYAGEFDKGKFHTGTLISADGTIRNIINGKPEAPNDITEQHGR